MKIYILLMPFSSVFALHPLLPIYLVYLVFFAIKELLLKKIRLYFHFPDFLLLCFLIIAFFSFILNKILHSQEFFTGFGHLTAYFASIFLFYYLIKIFLLNFLKKNVFLEIFRWIFISTNIVIFFIFIEFFIKSILQLPFDIYIPRVEVQELYASALGKYLRVRGFAEEPGHMAFFLEIMVPLSAYFLLKNKKFFQLFLFLICATFAVVFTFSSASFLIIPLTTLITLLFFLFNERGFILNSLLIKCSLIFILLMLLYFLIYILASLYSLEFLSFNDLLSQALKKLSLDNSSANIRYSRLLVFYELFSSSSFLNIIFGFGPGAYKDLKIDSILSLYPNLLFETGLIGFTIFMIFMLIIFYNLLKTNGIYKYFALFSFITSILHFLIISNYWYPWFWFLCVVIILGRHQSDRQQSKNQL